MRHVYYCNFRRSIEQNKYLKRSKRVASALAKYVPLNSLTLSRINQLKPGNSDSLRVAQHDTKLDNQIAPQADNDNNDEKDHSSKSSGNTNTSHLPWWKQFPKKTKNKNKQILNKLNEITENLPEWPWVNSVSKNSKHVYSHY